MTDKEMEEKREEFMTKWKWSVYDPEVPKIIWQWIEEVIKEVEKKKILEEFDEGFVDELIKEAVKLRLEAEEI